MELIKSSDDMRRWTRDRRCRGHSVGLVPTMGALHEGHLSLVRTSGQRCDFTVASIFVNPTQFGPQEDLERYPRTLDRDLQGLASAGSAAVFVPEVGEMYPAGFSTFVQPPHVAQGWEGDHRPTHFRGVATIVAKLFHAVPATHAFFGRKDYQQWKVIEAMARDLDFGIEIVACETVRQADGLALSSRNQYLSETDYPRARLLFESLQRVAEAFAAGQRSTAALAGLMVQTLGAGRRGGVDRVDYAVVVDAETLQPIERVDRPAVALIAAWVGQTRLLDNRLLEL